MPIPQTGVATDAMQGVLNITNGEDGWQETYFLGQTNLLDPDPMPSYALAVESLGKIARLRTWLLAAGFSVEWARVSKMNTLRDSVAAITAPIPSQAVDAEVFPVTEVCNLPDDGFLIRLQDDLGEFSTRHIRGVRDSWITNNLTAAALWDALPDNSAPLVVPALGATVVAQTAVNNFALALMQLTVHAKKGTLVLGTWFINGNNRIIYRRVGSKKTGRPSGLSRGRAPAHF